MRYKTHTIIKNYIDKNGWLATHRTGINGGGEKEAMHLFNGTVKAAQSTHPKIVGVTLVDAKGNIVAEWVKTERVAA